MADIEKKEHIDFTALAKQIDSTIDPEFVELLQHVEVLNILLKCNVLGNDELIPVGSCVDGSKVTMAGDCGDMDMLIVSNRIILKEYLFDYDNTFPAFLHIRVNNEHQKYFKTVNDPIEGVYLPVAVLKELRKRSFLLSKLLIQYDRPGDFAEHGKVLNVTRPTAVGKEQMQLYSDEKIVFDFIDESEKLRYTMTRMENFAKCVLGKMMNLPRNTDKTDARDGSNAFSTNSRLTVTDYDNISLLEMLNKILDRCKGKETNIDKTKRISYTNENRQTKAVGADGKDSVMYGADMNKEDNKATRDMFPVESLHADVYRCTKTLLQDCRTTQTKHKVSSNSKSDDDCENKNGTNLDPMPVKETCTTNVCIKESTKHESAKTKTSFSKLKSTDYVPAFRFEGWPRVADEWLTRPRKWPSKVTLKKVLKAGCQVVAKRPVALCSKSITEDRDPYFRLSFALSEVILARNMKEQQLLCWRVLKAYQKCFLKARPKCLTSYHWKNVLLWVSEDLDESFWTDENVSIAVLRCLDYMGDCLQKRNLPFYFVKKMNLLNGRDERLFDSLSEQVEAIRREPFAFLKRLVSEPPISDTYFIDVSEIENTLSQKAKAQNMDSISEAWVNENCFHFPSSSKSIKTDVQQILDADTYFLKKVWSQIEERSSRDSRDGQNLDSLRDKTLLDKFGKVIEALKNKDKEAVFKAFDGVWQTITDDKELKNENVTASERAIKQSFANVFNTLSSIMKGQQAGDGTSGNTSNLLPSFHQLALRLHENFESKRKTCDDGKASNEAHRTLSVFFGSFVKCFEGMLNNKDKSSSPADEIRKVINEAAQKIGNICKTNRKVEMDIDLD